MSRQYWKNIFAFFPLFSILKVQRIPGWSRPTFMQPNTPSPLWSGRRSFRAASFLLTQTSAFTETLVTSQVRSKRCKSYFFKNGSVLIGVFCLVFFKQALILLSLRMVSSTTPSMTQPTGSWRTRFREPVQNWPHLHSDVNTSFSSVCNKRINWLLTVKVSLQHQFFFLLGFHLLLQACHRLHLNLWDTKPQTDDRLSSSTLCAGAAELTE